MLNLICSSRQELSSDLLVLTFKSSTGQLPNWQAGQYFNFSTVINGQKVTRSYSVSNLHAQELEILVKVEGEFSQWLFKHCHPKQWIQAQGPLGDFGQALTQEPCLFIAGGVGLSPILSLLARRAEQGLISTDQLIISCQYLQQVPHLEQIQAWQQQGLKLSIHLSKQASKHHGRLQSSMIQTLCQGPQPQLLCCGPTGLMDEFKQAWLQAGKAPEHWHQETFKVQLQSEKPQQSLMIEFQGEFFSGNDAEILLDQIDQAGLYLSSSCRAGSCGSCRCKLIQGEVEAAQPFYALTEQEEHAGYILACCARPVTDLVIEAD